MDNVNKIFIKENKEYGFNFPFMLIVPEELRENPDLVVACTLPRDYARESKSFDEMLEKTCKDFSSIDPVHKHLSFDLGNILFVPFIPKIRKIRPGFLGNKLYNNDLSDYENIVEGNTDIISKEDVDKYYNLGDQFNCMIKYAISYLKSDNIDVAEKVIVSGYSEGAKFASHFSLLHPETIKSVVAGGTGGCMSMPMRELGGYKLSFPIGIADLKNFDMGAFSDIKFFFYMGDVDKADSAMPYFETEYYIDENGEKNVICDECGNVAPSVDENGNVKYILDENGNYKAKFNECFNDEEVNIINKTLGIVTQERFKKQCEIYKSLGLDCEFKLYEGNHRTIFDNKEKIFNDIDSYILNKKKASTITTK